jgi:hypothetical protein
VSRAKEQGTRLISAAQHEGLGKGRDLSPAVLCHNLRVDILASYFACSPLVSPTPRLAQAMPFCFVLFFFFMLFTRIM